MIPAFRLTLIAGYSAQLAEDFRLEKVDRVCFDFAPH
jgi:hypothetical protein